MLQKSAFAFLALPCLLFAQSSFAATEIGEKYAPYIGFEHGFSFEEGNEKMMRKYTPRIFAGFSPLITDNARFGLEMGFTPPVSYKYEKEYAYQSLPDQMVLKTYGADFYLTFHQSLSKKSYWFLKPGIEYCQRKYQDEWHTSSSIYHFNYTIPSTYLGARAGIGYSFLNGVGINAVVGSRLIDLNDNQKPKKFIFNLSAQYSF